MKKIIALLSVTAGIYSLNANALLTECTIKVKATSYSFIAEVGGGKGVAICTDVTGIVTKTPLKVALVGAALEVPGRCETKAVYRAVGAGFALDQILSAMAQVEFGPVGGGISLNPLGINAELNISDVSTTCPKLAEGKVMLAFKDGETTRHYRH